MTILAIGPYSQATKCNGVVYVSGCLGLIPETKTMVEGGVAAQARQLLTNLRNVLEAAGSSLEKVCKTTMFLQDMKDFAEANAVYSEFFSSNHPARSTIAVLALPLGALVEVECIAEA